MTGSEEPKTILNGDCTVALIDMPQPNSRNSKQPRQVQPVAQARLAEKRGSRLRDALVAETGRALFEYAIYDVIVPMFKDAAAAMFNRALYGDGRLTGGPTMAHILAPVPTVRFETLDGDSRPVPNPSTISTRWCLMTELKRI